MPKAIRIHEQGAPDVMKWEDVDLAPPAAGEIQLRHEVIGLNYIDTYHRSGVYKIPLPSGIGSEAAGVVEAVGDGVTEFKKGDGALIDGLGPDGIAARSQDLAGVLSRFQSGYLYHYAFVMLVGVACLVSYFMLFVR